MRTLPIRPTGVTPNIGTSSGINPGEDFEGPSSLSDFGQIEAEIPRAPRTPPGGGLLPGKPVPRSPIGLEAGQSAGGGLNVTVAVPIGGPISGRGGVNIGGDGSIKGGQVGLGIGGGPLGASIDVGTDQDEEGRGGCYQYVTISISFFSHTYGRNVCEPKMPPPSPASTPTPTPGTAPPTRVNCSTGSWIVGGYGAIATNNADVFLEGDDYLQHLIIGIKRNFDYFTSGLDESACDAAANSKWGRGKWTRTEREFTDYFPWHNASSPPLPAYVGEWYYLNNNGILSYGGRRINETGLRFWMKGMWTTTVADYRTNNNSEGFYSASYNWKSRLIEVLPAPPCPSSPTPTPTPSPPRPTSLSPPPPNPPPRKRNMNDECCKKSLILQVEILRLLGREIGPQGLVPQTTKKGFIGEEFERVETPITDPINSKKIKIRFATVYEMLAYALKQGIDLDVALDPKGYKIPTGYLQNPKYSRDSEQSLKSNTQPNKDKVGNKRELEINKDPEVKMSGFLQQQAYLFQMVRRLEYLFPAGELDDALVAKSLLIPGAKGDIKIHNMIMAYEILMQYMDAALGNPREILTVKDANPAIAGDQPIEVKALSISDLLRQNIKFHIDTGGDLDALVNLELRDFRTGMANRQDIVKIAEMVQALFEDSGMLEQQDYIRLHLEGDPYAGQWIKGEGFKPNPDLEKKTEEATEKVLRETMKPTNYKIKVSRRNKDEKTDIRDLFRGLADFFQRLWSIPSAGDAAKVIDRLIESAKFKVQTDAALFRQNITQAAAASRNRTKKRKK